MGKKIRMKGETELVINSSFLRAHFVPCGSSQKKLALDFGISRLVREDLTASSEATQGDCQ
jgi:hypothetical protein